MLFQIVSELLQDYCYLILLLFIGLLGFSAGLCQAPPLISKSEQEKPRIAKRADREADYRTSNILGTGRPARMQRGKAEEIRMNTSKDGSHGVDAMQQREKMQVKEAESEPIKAEVGLRQRIAHVQESSPRPAWLRSLSLGNRMPSRHANGTEQDSNPKRAPEKREMVVQRKVSLTGEEVKELADAFIARMHQRMWVQRQESLKRHPHSPLSYEAPPLP